MQNITQPREAGLCGDLFISPPPLPFSPGLCFFPASCPKDTHHYGANHRGFDHPPQSRVVIHIPAAARQTEGREMMLAGIISPGWLEGMQGHHHLLPASPSCSSEEGLAGRGALRRAAHPSPALVQVPWSFPLLPCQGRDWSPGVRAPVGSWARATFPLQT